MYAGVPLIYGRYLKMLISKNASKARALVLTFDDGPSNRLTPAILKLLAEYNAKATFFLLGRNIAGREEIVQQIAAQGHEICSHGYDHLDYWTASPVRVLKDIKRGWQAINAALGANHSTYPFRPPRGRLNLVLLLYLLIRRVPIIYWSSDLGDTWLDTIDPQKSADLVNRNQGTVFLAHDFDRAENEVGIENLVLEAIQVALKTAKESRMQVLTISELLNRQA
jgi:peptidoglycan/xylan/chitin deacetylase (PgdA/CDA1 family)